ncbi:glycosyltransferase family 39 protein [Chryseobacterium sp.]|uniref:glycosyltransferase family 39 protein n=1 Tax=Chryseobacterium sp. TaxID=1871047 RepID=UPI0011CB927D|nr:glycosyltransferase family 39 protein [Chryseobacterium sp.]TXF77770.1 glycosyltransferase family 39 protein [Chryseobacterium sp.]
MPRSILLLIFLLVVYIFSLGADPILGDSLGFTVTAAKGFDPGSNATNHFLYMNTLAVLHKVLPFLNPHYLFAGFSIVCSILTLFFLRKLLLLFGLAKITADTAMVFFGLSFTFWRISVFTEVYSFYLLFVALFLYQAFLFIKERRTLNFYFSAVLFGVLFLIHIQTILLVPFYLLFLYENHRNEKTMILKGLLLPAIVFSILVIPVVQGRQSFMSIFTDNAWGSSFFEFHFTTFLKSLGRNLIFLLYNFLFFLWFFFKGFKRFPYKRYFVVAVLPYLFFILKHDVSDSYVFHLVPYLFMLTIIAHGLEKAEFPLKYLSPLMVPIIYLVTVQTVNHSSFGTEMNAEKGFKGGVRYYFFPALDGNPPIETFTEAYENGTLKDPETYESQYLMAKEWEVIKKGFER